MQMYRILKNFYKQTFSFISLYWKMINFHKKLIKIQVDLWTGKLLPLEASMSSAMDIWVWVPAALLNPGTTKPLQSGKTEI